MSTGEPAQSASYRVLYANAGVKKRKSFSDGFLHLKPAAGSSCIVSLVSEEGNELRKSVEKNVKSFKEGAEVTFGAYLVQIEDLVSTADKSAGAVLTLAPSAKTNVSAPKPVIKGNYTPIIAAGKPMNRFIAPSLKVPTQKPLGILTTEQPASVLTEEVCAASETIDTFWDEVIDIPAQSSVKHIKNVAVSSTNSLGNTYKSGKNVPASTPTHHSTISTLPFKPPSNQFIKPMQYAPENKIELDPSLLRVMRPHQITGAEFLIARLQNNAVGHNTNINYSTATKDSKEDYSEYDLEVGEENVCTGAILADEMGVGKTLTAIATIWAFVRTKTQRKCLIITPSSLVDNWVKEIKHWLGTKLKPLVIRSGSDASAIINTFAISMASLYPVMVLSYEMFRKHATLLNSVPGLELMVCDEGHRLKNIGGTKTMQALSACKAYRRIILSGTPVQNDLDELYAVVSFVAPGYLGTLSLFKSRIANSISRGNDHKASRSDKEAAGRASAALRQLLGRIMLRRTQADILQGHLPPRTDFVVYCALNAAQREEYEHTAAEVKRSIGLGSVSLSEYDLLGEALEENKSTAAVGNILPMLQTLRQTCNGTSSSSSNNSGSSAYMMQGKGISSSGAAGSSVGGIQGRSTKLQVLACLLHHLRTTSPLEKVVIVSNFTSTLDTVNTLLQSIGWGNTLRLDGKVPVELRQGLVNRFNNADDPSQVFLLSAKAGGVGINLIGGSRLIMFDVDWNPAVDQQAMSRVWREGQTRPVFVYRLVSEGTIEDAILQRQRSKTDLAGFVEGNDDKTSTDMDANNLGGFGQQPKNKSEKRMSLTRKDVIQLLYPNIPLDDSATDTDMNQSDRTAHSGKVHKNSKGGGKSGSSGGRRGTVVYSSSDESQNDGENEREGEGSEEERSEGECSVDEGSVGDLDVDTLLYESITRNTSSSSKAGCARDSSDSESEHDTEPQCVDNTVYPTTNRGVCGDIGVDIENSAQDSAVVKEITDAVLLRTMRLLGPEVIVRAICVD